MKVPRRGLPSLFFFSCWHLHRPLALEILTPLIIFPRISILCSLLICVPFGLSLVAHPIIFYSRLRIFRVSSVNVIWMQFGFYFANCNVGEITLVWWKPSRRKCFQVIKDRTMAWTHTRFCFTGTEVDSFRLFLWIISIKHHPCGQELLSTPCHKALPRVVLSRVWCKEIVLSKHRVILSSFLDLLQICFFTLSSISHICK
jgi:hypothetical protein